MNTPACQAGTREPAMDTRLALLNSEQASQADKATVDDGTPLRELMRNAGRAVAREIEQRWSARPVTVLCGPGGNGGDGFVAARVLAAHGWPVRVALLGAREQLTGAAREHADAWKGPLEPLAPGVLDGVRLVVDALFGAGLDRALAGPASATLAAAAQRRLPIVAVDVPSGVRGDTGEDLGAVDAALTVTFFRKKPGHLLLPGRDLCGETVVADIGIPSAVLVEVAPNTFENDPSLWISALPRPLPSGNKYSRGHALIVGGYPMTGAARMAARAAARMGAGLTTIAVPLVALPIYAASLTSIMVTPLEAPQDLLPLLADPKVSAFLIGPGAGVTQETRDRALAMLATGRPTVLDADALTAFMDDRSRLERAVQGPCVLTPHEGEFERLFKIPGDKLSRSRAAALGSNAIIVLKGRDTVIAAPDGTAIINADAPPSLATAGAGDVLGGMVLGLLAQGMHPLRAAAAAVWLHGAAAARFGPGLLAEDLPDLLPDVLRQLFGEHDASDGTQRPQDPFAMDRVPGPPARTI
jgi:ADP-dependent NAD(P)H-hydrate dehydratase / NAD(P)H-hydrate epimerase